MSSDQREGAIELRASDVERERVVETLREHTVAGRLTLEEFSDRADLAYAAKTVAELDEVTRDLPLATHHPHRRPRRFTGVAFGHTQRTGRWLLPRRGIAFVCFGDADLDLREAELTGPLASITAFVLFGNVDVYVPEGIEVDLGGFSVFGHRREWGRQIGRPGAMLVRVNVFSLFGTSDVWRVPSAWVGRSFREVIKALRRGEQNELPPG